VVRLKRDYFMKKGLHMFWKQYSQQIALMAFSALIVFVFLESGIRLYENKLNGIPFAMSVDYYKEDELGWKGKKIFGPLKTDKKKIFIIGDSFTEGHGVREENMYYSKLKHSLETELYIYGGDGYGTLQELLVFERYVDLINPDLVIIQITGNDIINNSVELERRSYYNNNLLLRPYYVHGNIQMLYPSRLGMLRYALTSRSRLFQRMFEKSDLIMSMLVDKKIIQTAEDVIAEKGTDYPQYNTALKTTDELIHKLVARAGSVPVVFMPIGNYEPYYSAYKDIVAKRGAHWIDEPAISISQRVLHQEAVLQEDEGHWNDLGHAYVGEVLLDSLMDHNLVPNVIPRKKGL